MHVSPVYLLFFDRFRRCAAHDHIRAGRALMLMKVMMISNEVSDSLCHFHFIRHILCRTPSLFVVMFCYTLRYTPTSSPHARTGAPHVRTLTCTRDHLHPRHPPDHHTPSTLVAQSYATTP